MKIQSFVILFSFVTITALSQEISVPPGFKTSVVVSELGKNRHIAVNSNGDIYVKLNQLKNGKGIIILRDVNHNGKYSIYKSFGNYPGTGIAVKGNYLYASSDSKVYRYTLKNNEVINTEKPDVIVTGFPEYTQHSSKSIALDDAGNIYVNIGAPSNSCQKADRSEGSPGMDPCPYLEKSAGIWKFRADKTVQTFSASARYAMGIRNTVGLDWNTQTNRLFVMQHGRDQLYQNFPKIYTKEQGADLPAEEMYAVKEGADYGWPYCYYDQIQKKKVLAPEYGGDGKKEGKCANTEQPVIAFPGHWAPNAMVFYTGKMFPERYRNGAFIAFHGSWNRSPYPQQGFNVVFVPFKDGKPSGDYQVFASGFAGSANVENPGDAVARPCGLAVGPDGALYVSDSQKGKIWKITYGE